jgi:hypothetical protein
VVDTRTRSWSEDDVDVLRVLSAAASRELALRSAVRAAAVANDRLTLLARVGQALAETLDAGEAVARLSRLVVPSEPASGVGVGARRRAPVGDHHPAGPGHGRHGPDHHDDAAARPHRAGRRGRLGRAAYAALVVGRSSRAGPSRRRRHPDPAGHPPDVPLAVVAAAPRRDHAVAIGPGETLLLYTDGLIETRTQELEARQAELLKVLAAHRDLGLDELLNTVLVEMVGDRPLDDVALIAVRFHPEDRPRPAGAGPSTVPGSR